MDSVNSFSSPINPAEIQHGYQQKWPYLKPGVRFVTFNFQGPSFWVGFSGGCFRRRLPTFPAKALELQVWWKLSASGGSMEVPGPLFFP